MPETKKEFFKVATAECPNGHYFDTIQEAKNFCDSNADLDYGFIVLCDKDKNEIGDWGDFWEEGDYVNGHEQTGPHACCPCPDCN